MDAFRRCAIALTALLCLGAQQANAAGADILRYTVRLHGVALLDAAFCFRLDGGSYEAGVVGRTVGLLDFLVHGRSEIHVDGAVGAAGEVKPRAYAERSRLSGQDYGVSIDYPGGSPVLRQQTPPQEKYRLPVPRQDLVRAIDGVSAVVVQSLAAARGVCAGDIRLYDGRQLRLLSLRDGARDTLRPGAGSAFRGEALRCDTVSTMLAGFLKSSSVKSQSEPMRGRLWLAQAVPGDPNVPVRMVFDAAFWGDVVVQLDAASRAVVPNCSGAGWSANK